jgi:hypothetical protein
LFEKKTHDNGAVSRRETLLVAINFVKKNHSRKHRSTPWCPVMHALQSSTMTEIKQQIRCFRENAQFSARAPSGPHASRRTSMSVGSKKLKQISFTGVDISTWTSAGTGNVHDICFMGANMASCA